MKYFVTSRISENISETPEGYLVCIAVPIARTGEMEYGEHETPLEGDESGRVMVNREEDEVFRPETIASFEGKPITIQHPDDFVTPENWKELAKGTIQNVRRGDGENKNDLLADLLITDRVAISLVKNGLREVSCGYEADYEQVEDGKGRQTNILGNHLALVDQGRAGDSYAIKDHKGEAMDAMERLKSIFSKAEKEATEVIKSQKTKDKDGKPVEKNGAMIWDEKAYDDVMSAVTDMGEKMSSMKKDMKDFMDKISHAGGLGEVAEYEAEDDDEEKESKDAEEKEGVRGEKAGDEEEKEMKDADEEEDPKEKAKDDADPMDERLKKLELAVEKLLARSPEDTSAESEDEEEESEDDDFEESHMAGDSKGSLVGDTASRIEILAPGLKTKDKRRALVAAYATVDGQKVIHQLTGGKKPKWTSEKTVDQLFMAASEVLKHVRSKELGMTKQTRDADAPGALSVGKGATPEELNKKYEEFYAKQAQH